MAANAIPTIHVSSVRSNIHDKDQIRLNSAFAWCAVVNNEDQFVQVDLVEIHRVTGFATQGNPNADEWITIYNLRYTVNGIDWLYERISGNGALGIKV